MLAKATSLLRSLSTGYRIPILVAALTAYLALTLPALKAAPGGDIEPLDARFYYSPDVAFATLEAYGEAVGFWILMYVTWDVGTPVLYSLVLGTSMSRLIRRLFGGGRRVEAIALLPFLAAAFDLLENACVIIMLKTLDHRPTALAWTSTIFTMSKTSLLGVCFLMVVAGLVMVAIREARGTGAHGKLETRQDRDEG